MCETAVTKTRGRARERAVCACDVVYTDGPSPPTPTPQLPPPCRRGDLRALPQLGMVLHPIARSRSYVVQGAIVRARGHTGTGARWLWVHVGAQARGKSSREHAWVGAQGLDTCRGLVRRCPRGSGWRSISVDGAGLGQSQSGRPGSGSCLLGASFSVAPSSRRLRADSLPRVTRHGNPQRCSIRRWWGKLRGAGLERVVCSGGLRARSEQSTTQRQQDHQQVSGPGAFRHRAPRGPPPYFRLRANCK